MIRYYNKIMLLCSFTDCKHWGLYFVPVYESQKVTAERLKWKAAWDLPTVILWTNLISKLRTYVISFWRKPLDVRQSPYLRKLTSLFWWMWFLHPSVPLAASHRISCTLSRAEMAAACRGGWLGKEQSCGSLETCPEAATSRAQIREKRLVQNTGSFHTKTAHT